MPPHFNRCLGHTNAEASLWVSGPLRIPDGSVGVFDDEWSVSSDE